MNLGEDFYAGLRYKHGVFQSDAPLSFEVNAWFESDDHPPSKIHLVVGYDARFFVPGNPNTVNRAVGGS
jgi:hypothetical protein